VRSGRHAIWLSHDGSSVALWSTDGVKVQKLMPDADDIWLIQRGDEALMWRCDGKSPCGLWRLDPTADKPKLIARAPFEGVIEARSDYRYKGKQCLMLMIPSGAESRSGRYWCEQGGKLVKGAPEGYRAALLDNSMVFEAMTDWYATARVTLSGQRVLAAAALNQPETPRMLVRRGGDFGYVDPSNRIDGLFVLPGGVEDPEDDAGGWRPLGPPLIPLHGAPQLLAPLDDGRVIFFARDDLHGMEPWVMAADGSGAALLADLQQGEPSSLPMLVETHGDVVCFTLTTSARHCTDGTAKGTRRMPKPRSWPLSGGVVSLEAVAPGWALRDARGATLMSWEAPGLFDEEGELGLPGDGPEDPEWRAEEAKLSPLLRVWRGRLYAIVGGGEDTPSQVMVTDGTAAGTRALNDAANVQAWGGEPLTLHAEYSAALLPSPNFMPTSQGFAVDAAGRVSWMVLEDGQEVRWSTDGTPANTRPTPSGGLALSHSWEDMMLSVQRAGDPSPVPLMKLPEQGRFEVLGERGGLLWFMMSYDDKLMDLSLKKATLWVTDGTLEGTRELKAPAPVMVEPRPVLTQAGLVFSMRHVEYGRELFLWPVLAR
jgi:ELWxxDGT repeat protein